MAIPAMPAQGAPWLTYAQALDTEARTIADKATAADITAAKARANHTGTQPASTITGLATVATTGAYADLVGKPASKQFSPLDYGAVGNGTTDDTTALQATIAAAAAAGGGAVVIPSGYTFKSTSGVTLTTPGVSILGLGGVFRGKFLVGDTVSASVDYSATSIQGVTFDNADPNSLTDECLIIRNARGLRILSNIFRNLGKAIVATTEYAATGFHTLGMIEVRGNYFTSVNYGIYADTTAWDVLSDWTIQGNIFNRAADTPIWITGAASGRAGGIDGVKLIDNVFFGLNFANSTDPLWTRKRYSVYLGQSNFVTMVGNHFFEPGLSALRMDTPTAVNIQANHFVWPGQRQQSDCIEIHGGTPRGVIEGNTFENWTRAAVGFYDSSSVADANIGQNTYKWVPNPASYKGTGTVDSSNSFRMFTDTTSTGRPVIRDFTYFAGGIFDSLGTSSRIGGRDTKSTWGGVAGATRRSVSFTTGAAQDVFLLSNFIDETIYAGLVHVTVRPSDTSGKVASYVLNVVGGNAATAPTCATINAIGTTAGGAANDPSFTFTCTSSHTLRATAVGSTAGAFFFDVVAIGSFAGR